MHAYDSESETRALVGGILLFPSRARAMTYKHGTPLLMGWVVGGGRGGMGGQRDSTPGVKVTGDQDRETVHTVLVCIFSLQRTHTWSHRELSMKSYQ